MVMAQSYVLAGRGFRYILDDMKLLARRYCNDAHAVPLKLPVFLVLEPDTVQRAATVVNNAT